MALGSYSGAGLSMGVSFTLVDNFSSIADRIEARINRLANAVTIAGRRMAKAWGTAAAASRLLTVPSMVGPGGGAAASTAAVTRNLSVANDLLIKQYAIQQTMRQIFEGSKSLLGLFIQGAKVDAQFQNFELAFRSFLGTAREASRVFNQIKQDAILNPKFSIAGMEKANLMLISQGINAETSMKTIKDLSTILLGVGAGEPELQRVAMALEKVKASGFLTGPQLRSLTTARVPMMKMLEAIGVHLDPSKVAKSAITFEQLTAAISNAVLPGQQFGRVMEMLTGNVDAAAAQLKENWQSTLADIGKSFRPLTLWLLNTANAFVNFVSRLTSSPFGVWVVRITLVLAIMLTVLTGVGLAVVTLTLGVNIMAGAFGEATAATIRLALSQRGLAAGLRATGRAAWASLGPYIIIAVVIGVIIGALYGMSKALDSNNRAVQAFGVVLMLAMGPLGWIVGAIVLIRRAVREFDAVMNDGAPVRQGFVGFLQRIGGILRLVVALFSSYNSETKEFVIADKLYAALEKLGLAKFASKLSTWIGRILELWEGLKEGFKEAWGVIKETLLGIVNAFMGPEHQFKDWGDLISSNSDKMEKWREIGRTLGKVIAYGLIGIIILLGALTVALTALAAVSLIVLGIIIVPFAFMLYSLYKLYNWIKALLDPTTEWGETFRDAIHMALKPLLLMIEATAKLVQMLSSIADFTMPGLAAPASDGELKTNEDYFVGGGNNKGKKGMSPFDYNLATGRMNETTALRFQRREPGSSTSTVTNNTTQPVAVNVNLDGDKIATIMVDKMELERAMNNA